MITYDTVMHTAMPSKVNAISLIITRTGEYGQIHKMMISDGGSFLTVESMLNKSCNCRHKMKLLFLLMNQ